jgi:hypothetical protein
LGVDGDSDPLHLHPDTGVATDRAGNTYVLGIFQGSVQLGSQVLMGDVCDGVVAKLDPNGNFLWAQPLRATSFDDLSAGRRGFHC